MMLQTYIATSLAVRHEVVIYSYRHEFDEEHAQQNKYQTVRAITCQAPCITATRHAAPKIKTAAVKCKMQYKPRSGCFGLMHVHVTPLRTLALRWSTGHAETVRHLCECPSLNSIQCSMSRTATLY